MSKNELKDFTLFKAAIIDSGNETPEEFKIEKSGDWYTLSMKEAITALLSGLSTDELGESLAEKNIAIIGLVFDECPPELLEAIPKDYEVSKINPPFRVDLSTLNATPSVSVLNTKIDEIELDVQHNDDGTRVLRIDKLKLIDNISKAEYTIF